MLNIERAISSAGQSAGLTYQRSLVQIQYRPRGKPDEFLVKVTASKKILDREKLLKSVSIWREEGQTIVFTNGVFDILHRGHLLSLEKASQFGDRLIVGVNDHYSAQQLEKGSGRPVNSEEDRAVLVAGLAAVDAVTLFSEPTPLELIRVLHPDVLVKGADYMLTEIVGREYATRTERIELVKGLSTSNLIERIKLLGES